MTPNGWPPLLRRLITRRAAGNRAPSTIGPVPGIPLRSRPTPPEDRNGTGTTTGDPVVPVPSIPETIVCCACGQLLEDRSTARCWMAPDGIAVAADLACLLWLGETELGLTE